MARITSWSTADSWSGTWEPSQAGSEAGSTFGSAASGVSDPIAKARGFPAERRFRLPPRRIFRLSRFPEGRTPSPGPVLRRTYLPPKADLATGLIRAPVFVSSHPFEDRVFERLFWNRCPRGGVFSRWSDCTSQRRFSRVCFDVSTFGGRRSSPRLKAGVSAAKKLMNGRKRGRRPASRIRQVLRLLTVGLADAPFLSTISKYSKFPARR